MEQKPAGDSSNDAQKQPEYILTPPPVTPAPPPQFASPPSPDKICPNCGTVNPSNAVFCHKCGIRLPENNAPYKKICAGCGAQNALTAEYCFKCGLKLPEPAGAYQHLKYGGFWVRLLAWFIDSTLIGVLVSIFTTPYILSRAQQFTDFTNSYSYGYEGAIPMWLWQFYLIFILFTYGTQIVYETIAVGKWGKTIGKAALGLKVVKPDGSKVSYARALGRCLAYFLNSFTLGLSFLIIAVTRKKRGLHDYIADTIVIKTR